MTRPDTTKSISHTFIFQVISSSNYQIYYYIFMSKITTHLFVIHRYAEDLYKPCVKMRTNIRTCDTSCRGVSTLLNHEVKKATSLHHLAQEARPWDMDQTCTWGLSPMQRRGIKEVQHDTCARHPRWEPARACAAHAFDACWPRPPRNMSTWAKRWASLDQR